MLLTYLKNGLRLTMIVRFIVPILLIASSFFIFGCSSIEQTLPGLCFDSRKAESFMCDENLERLPDERPTDGMDMEELRRYWDIPPNVLCNEDMTECIDISNPCLKMEDACVA